MSPSDNRSKKGRGVSAPPTTKLTSQPSGSLGPILSVSEEELEHKRELLAQRLRETREYIGLSQQQAAERSGLSRLAVSAVETGRRRLESVELAALARTYGQPVGYFLEHESSSELLEVQHIARAAKELSDADRTELLRFARFLSHYKESE